MDRISSRNCINAIPVYVRKQTTTNARRKLPNAMCGSRVTTALLIVADKNDVENRRRDVFLRKSTALFSIPLEARTPMSDVERRCSETLRALEASVADLRSAGSDDIDAARVVATRALEDHRDALFALRLHLRKYMWLLREASSHMPARTESLSNFAVAAVSGSGRCATDCSPLV